MVCVEVGEGIPWPRAGRAAADDKRATIDTTATESNRDMQAEPMPMRGGGLGATIATTEEMADCGIGILFFTYERRRVGAAEVSCASQ